MTMAKLLSYFNLCPINDTKEFLGVARGPEEGCVINTLEKNIIIVVKLRDQNQIKSWTIVDKLISKVVFDFKLGKYVGAFSPKSLRCWDENVIDINKVKKTKLRKNILSLHTIRNEESVVLYTDGSCESISSALSPNVDESEIDSVIDDTKFTIGNVSFFENDNGQTSIAYFITDKTHNTLQLVYFALDQSTLRASNENVHKIRIQRGDIGTLKGYCVVDGNKAPSLVTIWSDKRIFMNQLTQNGPAYENSPGNFVAMLNMLNLEHPLSMVCVSKDVLAIYGSNQGQDGSSLILYNTHYKVCQSKQFFKIFFQNSQLFVVGKSILLAAGQSLSVVTFKMCQEQLSDLIGTQRTTMLGNYIDMDCINEEEQLEDAIMYVPKSEFKPTLANCVGSMSLESENNKALVSIQEFKQHAKKLCRINLLVDIVEKEALEKDTVSMSTFGSALGASIYAEEISLLVTEMSRSGACEIEITNTVVPLLIAVDLEQELIKCLRNFSNFSEKMLVKILSFAVQREMDSGIQSINNENSLLRTLMSCTFDRETIVHYLRSDLNLDNVIYLINQIYNLFSSEDASFEYQDEKLFTWFTTLLDSHYQQFILSQDTKVLESLEKWQETLEKYEEVLKDLRNVGHLIENVVAKKSLSAEKKFCKWYSIQAVKLY